MFRKNDNALLKTRTIIMITLIVVAVLNTVFWLVMAILSSEASAIITYILFMLLGLLFCWLTWIIAKLYLSYLCDVKLIRNKLYGESNDNLEAFLDKYPSKRTDFSEQKDDVKDVKRQFGRFYQQLFIDGKITEEEYRKRMNEFNDWE